MKRKRPKSLTPRKSAESPAFNLRRLMKDETMSANHKPINPNQAHLLGVPRKAQELGVIQRYVPSRNLGENIATRQLTGPNQEMILELTRTGGESVMRHYTLEIFKAVMHKAASPAELLNAPERRRQLLHEAALCAAELLAAADAVEESQRTTPTTAEESEEANARETGTHPDSPAHNQANPPIAGPG